MMIEGRILNCMTEAASAANFYIASAYAKGYAEFLGIPAKDYPDEPMFPKSQKEIIFEWQQYYFKMLSVICRQINRTLEDVRSRYRKNQDIPTPTNPAHIPGAN